MFRIVDLKQDTPEWLQWRKEGIGASDAPIIMGLSPYPKQNKHSLWVEKRGGESCHANNSYILEKGKEFEKRIRAKYELMTDRLVPGVCMEMVEHPYLRASLDGWDKETGFIIEIKYVGKKQFEAEEIPPHHYCQFQMQMLVSGAKDMTEIYGFVDEFNELHEKQRLVMRDEAYIKNMKETLIGFWMMVEENIEPNKIVLKTRKRAVV